MGSLVAAGVLALFLRPNQPRLRVAAPEAGCCCSNSTGHQYKLSASMLLKLLAPHS